MVVCLASAVALRVLLTGTPQSLVVVMTALAAYGVGLGLYIAPNNSATIGEAPADKSGVAGGLLNLLRVFGAGVGVAAASTALGWGLQTATGGGRAHNPCARGRAALGRRRRAVDARNFRRFGGSGGADPRQFETSDRQACARVPGDVAPMSMQRQVESLAPTEENLMADRAGFCRTSWNTSFDALSSAQRKASVSIAVVIALAAFAARQLQLHWSGQSFFTAESRKHLPEL